MLLIIELVGAIGLLLFGLRQVRNGMIRAFGTSLKRLACRTQRPVLPTGCSATSKQRLSRLKRSPC